MTECSSITITASPLIGLLYSVCIWSVSRLRERARWLRGGVRKRVKRWDIADGIASVDMYGNQHAIGARRRWKSGLSDRQFHWLGSSSSCTICYVLLFLRQKSDMPNKHFTHIRHGRLQHLNLAQRHWIIVLFVPFCPMLC